MKKSVFFICPIFKGYEKKILDELKLTYNVDSVLYDESKLVYNMTFMVKIIYYFIELLVRFSVFIKSELLYFYFRELKLKCCLNGRTLDYLLKPYVNNHYDKLFVIKGLGFSKEAFANFNAKKKYLHLWDSIARFPICLKYTASFNSVSSFDRKDCDYYGYNYICNFSTVPKNINPPIKYCLFYVGAFTYKRYMKLVKLKRKCKALGVDYFFKLVTKKNKLFLDDELYTLSALTLDDYYYLFCSSEFIVELEQPFQQGDSQRVIDALSIDKFVFQQFKSHENTISFDVLFSAKSIQELSIFNIKNNEDYSVRNWIVKILG